MYGTGENMKEELIREAAQKVVDELKDADSVICELCRRLNPQHEAEDCMCDERESRLRVISKFKKEVG